MSKTPILRIFQVETDGHRRCFRQLFREYVEWVNEMCVQEYDVSFDT
ncbi:MAG: hypothetical protein GTO63_24120, partial [Anaerolineae bacterium]|nr:hypothetical protein [Anaerolineae bacterium]NIN97809.1 hypothetical protein [Anaerolineae bacterium]NIQ80804.1 hypothetical protein [Anaerolineae bacterium]